LLVEDDGLTREHIRAGLSARGYDVETAVDGRSGLERASTRIYDVLIVDRLLPGLDGLALLKALRTARVTTPAIVLTALGGIADRVEGLRGGADDYLVKPFDVEELDARIEALGRRPALANGSILLYRGGLKVNRLARTAVYGDELLELTSSEFAMLELLMSNAGRTVTKAMILESVFDLDSHAAGQIVEPHISRLRAKLERAGLTDAIRTLRGVGYAFV
jgi:two-component system OmpR family response regulator